MHRSFERRQVTVVFCELTDSITFFEESDPVSFSYWIESFRTMCRDQVLRFGGTLGYFCGDRMLAYFGYPLSHPDDPERSVRAALGIIDAMKSDVVDDAIADAKQLSVRIGIDTAEAAIGCQNEQCRSESVDLFGEPLNVAARLQSLANPNQIILSERTHSLLDGSFKFSHLGYQSIRGPACSIAIFEVQA